MNYTFHNIVIEIDFENDITHTIPNVNIVDISSFPFI